MFVKSRTDFYNREIAQYIAIFVDTNEVIIREDTGTTYAYSTVSGIRLRRS